MAKKVLVVEDDVFVRDIYARELKKGGYEVEIAEDGLEGLEKIKTGGYDIVLLDIMMPKMTGVDLLKNVRDPNFPAKDIPVYLLTNLGQGSIIKQCLEIGAQGYLLKARVLPSQVLKSINDFFEFGPMKVDLSEFGLE